MKGKRNKPGTSKSQERLSPFFPRTTAPKAFFSPATLQPQLTIGQPGDRYEQEADAMGDRVARMSDTPQPAVQEQCADCEQKEALRRQAIPEEDKREEEPTVQAKQELRRQPEKDQEEEPVQTKPDLRRQPEKKEEEEPPVQTKREIRRKADGPPSLTELRRAGEEAGQANLQRQGEEEKHEDEPLQTKPLMRKTDTGPSVATPELTNRLNQSKGGGRALPANTQRFMGRAFDADFSGVRVHTDERAAEMNRGLQAKAFTHGGDIYFNRGQYQPDTTEGRRLLGHELTHVVQQEGENVQKIDKDQPTMIEKSNLEKSLESQIDNGKIIVNSSGNKKALLGEDPNKKATDILKNLILELSKLQTLHISSLMRTEGFFHSTGRAVDIGNEEIAKDLLSIIATDSKVLELKIDEIIFDAGQAGESDRNKWNYDRGKKHNYGTATLDQHKDHIHFAVKI